MHYAGVCVEEGNGEDTMATSKDGAQEGGYKARLHVPVK
jgi:hypothetical protein